jgi:hypothetical protein
VVSGSNRIEPGRYRCPSCRHGFPEISRPIAQGQSPGRICRDTEIAASYFLKVFGRSIPRVCHAPCGRDVPPAESVNLHPIAGELYCRRCIGKARMSCGLCGKRYALAYGAVDRGPDGTAVFTCRRCRCGNALAGGSARCSEPGCRTPIGRRLRAGCHHPEDPGRRICEGCYTRIRRKTSPLTTCDRCGRRVKAYRGTVHRVTPDGTSTLCRYCHRKASGVYERMTAVCPECGGEKPLVRLHPTRSEARVSQPCGRELDAPRAIVRIAQTTRSWPLPHRHLFDAALQRGSSRGGDLECLRALTRVQPFLPPGLDLSLAGLGGLYALIRRSPGLPLGERSRVAAAIAVSRGRLELCGPSLAQQRYRLLLNRSPLTQPVPATDLLLEFVDRELPRLGYAPSTIAGYFFVLRSFLQWLAGSTPRCTSSDRSSRGIFRSFGSSAPCPVPN